MKLKFILIVSFVSLYSLICFSQVQIKSYDAKKYIGKKVIVTGIVAQISVSNTGAIILNIGERYRYNELIAIINKPDVDKFNNIIQCAGRTVEINGTITGSKGTPQIILKNNVQIKIID